MEKIGDLQKWGAIICCLRHACRLPGGIRQGYQRRMKSVWEVASAWARTTNEDEHGETASVDEYDVNKYAFAVYIFLLVELNKVFIHLNLLKRDCKDMIVYPKIMFSTNVMFLNFKN